MTSMPQDFKIFWKNFLDIFLLLVPLEICSHYSDTDIAYWFKNTFSGSCIKLNGPNTFFMSLYYCAKLNKLM